MNIHVTPATAMRRLLSIHSFPTGGINASRRIRPQLPCRRRQHTFAADDTSTTPNTALPKIAQASLWNSIFPKTLRDKSRGLFQRSDKKPINPATYFIWIYILIGSQAIRIIGVQNESKTYIRKADLQINKLKEVIGKLQRGEPVDVEQVLGTGDETEEEAWEQALREIEDEERLWQQRRKERDEERQRLEDARVKTEAEREDANPVNDRMEETTAESHAAASPSPPRAPGFF